MVLILAIRYPPIKEKVVVRLNEITPKGRVAIIIFVVIPFLLLIVGAVVLLPPLYQPFAIRSIFIITVCLFPATMYYLFISTRKYSLLGEFVTNLNRLGLLSRRRLLQHSEDAETNLEPEAARQCRVDTYLQKFQGIYGPLHEKLISQTKEKIDQINEETEEKDYSPHEKGTPEVFTPETTIPVVFATILIALGWLLILPPWQGPSQAQQWKDVFTPEQTPVNFAFLGAYFFSIQMLSRRYARRDLRASAYVSVSLRIILAVIGIWAVGALWAAEEALPSTGFVQLTVIGFIIGVFPQTAWQLVQASTKKVAGIFIYSFKTPLPLQDIDGLTVWNEARLEEEDIENIPNMATADLVDLMLTTRISPDRIIDWVDQAILYVHLGHEDGKELRKKLRSYGIRTASSLIEVYRRSEFHSDRGTSERILPNEDPGKIPSLIDAISTNPNMELILEWRGIPKQFETTK
ncbi:MAG: hypothetical protein C4B59_00010 [Candidatus Methanogaster sp.]|uniref:Uncharacterized protein n=1 Tax=Candidatus Methanogaster sp. TaxID=3386292 RepID=A0AC61L6V9_9EURY|nr:MAG: hypothetical protein C4B59_00010 [ANME-2 cluster archaeon]